MVVRILQLISNSRLVAKHYTNTILVYTAFMYFSKALVLYLSTFPDGVFVLVLETVRTV